MLLLLSCLVILPSTRAFIDCGMACHQCRHDMRDLHIKEVYCAMCRECRERRRERRAMMHEVLRDKEYGWDPQEVQAEPPPGCPTPPDCDSSIEVLHNDVTTQPPPPATTCYPVTTPAPTCPPIIPCRDRKKMTESVTTTSTTTTTPMPPVRPVFMPCVPCMPMCPCPQQQPPVQATTWPTTTRRDFFYLYIGFPKGALNKTDD